MNIHQLRTQKQCKTPKKCDTTGKQRFRDHREAVEFLHLASNARQRAELSGRESKRQEVRTYECDRCHGWHVTSWATCGAGKSDQSQGVAA
ncbi:hypothetical protein C3E87_07600 [Tessaracoccus sp. ZS01]|nr:hypothetical protein [Tessaracoccus sp. ZS01]OMG57047.1 hypothetical protein BJN44_07615 [Tessaracoccus sp. ZS01]